MSEENSFYPCNRKMCIHYEVWKKDNDNFISIESKTKYHDHQILLNLSRNFHFCITCFRFVRQDNYMETKKIEE